MKKEKKTQVVMLVSEKQANIFRYQDGILQYQPALQYGFSQTPQHLYFLSNDEIKEGWEGYAYKQNIVGKIFKHFFTKNTWYNDAKKIIASTDKSLGLAEPTKEWIEYFVSEYNKGNIITEVMVEYEIIYIPCSCSKADHFDECDKDCKESKILTLRTKPDNTIIISAVEETWDDIYDKLIDWFKRNEIEPNSILTIQWLKDNNYQVPKQLEK